MPSLDMYKKMLSSYGKTNGQVRKNQSDMIMEYTWNEDIQSRIGYLYDQYHDDEFNITTDLHPGNSSTKIPVEIKFIQSEYNSLAKDQVSYHIQFKPSYICNVDYYAEMFSEKYGSQFPIGLYIDLPDEKGIYRRWLIVDNYTFYSNQFPTFQVLPTDYKLQWIHNNKRYESWAVLRSQSSYNSGVWMDYKVETVENQRKCSLPLNDITSTLTYNQRIIISAPIDEPITWRCTKVENTSPLGINRLTFAQDKFDQHNDYVEKNDFGKIVGMWADYFKTSITPESSVITPSTIYSVITYSGTTPQIKVGGSYKKFTVTFYDGDIEIKLRPGTWSFTIDGSDASSLVSVLTSVDSVSLADNQIKVRFDADDTYLGQQLCIKYTTDEGIASSVNVEIIGL